MGLRRRPDEGVDHPRVAARPSGFRNKPRVLADDGLVDGQGVELLADPRKARKPPGAFVNRSRQEDAELELAEAEHTDR